MNDLLQDVVPYHSALANERVIIHQDQHKPVGLDEKGKAVL